MDKATFFQRNRSRGIAANGSSELFSGLAVGMTTLFYKIADNTRDFSRTD